MKKTYIAPVCEQVDYEPTSLCGISVLDNKARYDYVNDGEDEPTGEDDFIWISSKEGGGLWED